MGLANDNPVPLHMCPGGHMTWQERAQAYISMSTKLSDQLETAQKELKSAALAEWLHWMDSE